jgi:hypothetical protein
VFSLELRIPTFLSGGLDLNFEFLLALLASYQSDDGFVLREQKEDKKKFTISSNVQEPLLCIN